MSHVSNIRDKLIIAGLIQDKDQILGGNLDPSKSNLLGTFLVGMEWSLGITRKMWKVLAFKVDPFY